MLMPDVNVLVYAHREDTREHADTPNGFPGLPEARKSREQALADLA